MASTNIDTDTDTVTVDQRRQGERRSQPDRRQQDSSVAVERRKGQRRNKVQRRRQIDPTTCERDYTADEIEFMRALDAYKRANGRMFPTCSEILEVIRSMGYVRIEEQTEESPDAAATNPVSLNSEAFQSAEEDCSETALDTTVVDT